MSNDLREFATNKDKFDGMLKVLSNATSKDELEKMSMLYVLDMSYPREDICLALKTIEVERGWRL